jgi:hypothetical protein
LTAFVILLSFSGGCIVSDNPFEVSAGSSGDRSGPDRGTVVAEVSARTVEILNQTRPWVLLMGILMWIGTVIAALATVFMVIMGLSTQQTMLVVMSVVYVLVTLVYGVMASSLTTYASKINRLNSSESVGIWRTRWRLRRRSGGLSVLSAWSLSSFTF